MLCSGSDFDSSSKSVNSCQAAPSGAPLGSRKKSILKKQMVVTDEGEDVFFKLPGAKKRQPKNKRSVMEAVKNLRGAEKQHSNTVVFFNHLYSFQNK